MDNSLQKLCNCNLQLGVVNFPSESGRADFLDPLVKIFENHKWSFQNPISKQRETVSVFDVIYSKSSLGRLNEKKFKMFPVCILPSDKLAHGFPKHAFKNEDDDCNQKVEKSESTLKKDWKTKFLSDHAENITTETFYSLFSNQETQGFMIQSYHSESYLQPLINKAKKQRENISKKSGKNVNVVEISDLEKNICYSLNIDIDGCMDFIQSLINKQEFDRDLEDREYIRKLFLKDDRENGVDKMNAVAYKFYSEKLLMFKREYDLLIVLENEKTILNIETKSTGIENYRNTLNSAGSKGV